MPTITSTGKVRLVNRRALLACAASLLTLASCSTFNGNDDAARVGGHHLSTKAARGFLAPDEQTTTGDLARDALTKWIRVTVLEQSSGAAAQATPSTAAELQARLTQALATIGGANAKTLYESGVNGSPVICLAAIPVATLDDANNVLTTLQSGTSFADAAKQFSTDPTIGQAGGVVVGADGSECFDTAAVNPDVTKVLTGTAVGQPVTAQLSTLTAVLMMRPYDDLLPESQARIASASVTDDQVATMVGDTPVYVDPRYGRWDPASGSVVPLTS
jgi:hypothetical protein